MRNTLVFLAVLSLAACSNNLDSALQSYGAGLTVLYTADSDPNCTQQIWSLSLSIGVDENTQAGGQLLVRGMDPVEGLELELMDHQGPGQMEFSVFSEAGYSWHIQSLVLTFIEASADRMAADYVLEMLDGTLRRGSFDVPVVANPGGCQ